MRRWYVKISGSAWNVEAATAEGAVLEIREFAGLYCHFEALEIGVDVDEQGYPLKQQVGNPLVEEK